MTVCGASAGPIHPAIATESDPRRSAPWRRSNSIGAGPTVVVGNRRQGTRGGRAACRSKRSRDRAGLWVCCHSRWVDDAYDETVRSSTRARQPTPTHDGAQELLCDPPRDCRHASRVSTRPATRPGWPASDRSWPRPPSTTALCGKVTPDDVTGWLDGRKHQANDASALRDPVPHPEVPRAAGVHQPRPAPAGCSASARRARPPLRPRRSHRTTHHRADSRTHPVPARIGRQPRGRDHRQNS